MAHQGANRFGEFWESIEDTDRAQPLFVVEGGRAADHRTRGDIAVSAALSRYNDAIANIAVSGNANLSGENHVLADDRGSGQTDLGAQQSILADSGAVTDLYQVIYLHPATNTGFANAGTVDTRVSLYLDIVFQDRRA